MHEEWQPPAHCPCSCCTVLLRRGSWLRFGCHEAVMIAAVASWTCVLISLLCTAVVEEVHRERHSGEAGQEVGQELHKPGEGGRAVPDSPAP